MQPPQHRRPPSARSAEATLGLGCFWEPSETLLKLDGVEAALEKWKGRESKMMDVLYKKYSKEIDNYYADRDSEKMEL